jgi:hypothetical protein
VRYSILPAPGRFDSIKMVAWGPVFDSFYFVHQPLAANGSITAQVTSLTGLITYPPAHPDAIVPAWKRSVMPWS